MRLRTGGVYPHPYGRGLYANVCQVMGTEPKHWLVPTSVGLILPESTALRSASALERAAGPVAVKQAPGGLRKRVVNGN